ncbi:MAG: mechanosensitive ion channel [Gammaproteobacteria bacterium]|nr:mechanosensitive ion channel [Gammaproteobacteria bacterium]
MNAPILRAMCLVLLALAPVFGTAQPQAPRPQVGPAAVPDVAELRRRLEAIENTPLADEALKARVSEAISLAKSRIQSAEAHAARLAEMQEMLASEPERMEEIRRAMETGSERATERPEPAAFESLAALEQRQVKELTELAALKSRLDELEKQVAALGIRPTAAREQLSAAKKRRAELETELKTLNGSTEPRAITDATRLAIEAGIRNRANEVAMLEQELFTYDVRARLLSAERDLAARQHARAVERVKTLEEVLANRRRADAERAQRDAEKARLEASFKHPLVRDIAIGNAELSEELARLVSGQELINAERARVAERMKAVEQNLSMAERGLEVAGLSQSLGEILRSQRLALPEMADTRIGEESPKELIGEAGVRLFRIMEEGEALRDVEAATKAKVSEALAGKAPIGDAAEIEREAESLLHDRQELLKKLQTAYRSYIAVLGDLDFEYEQLADKTEAYARFLDEHLIWIPSAKPININTFTGVGASLAWLLSPPHWEEVLRTLPRLWYEKLPLSSAIVALFLVLLWVSRRSDDLLARINRRVGKVQVDNYGLTPLALAVTIARAGAWPLFVIYSGELLLAARDVSAFTNGVGDALAACGKFFFVAQFFRLLGVRNGVGQVHFGWREVPLRLVRRNLAMLIVLGIPLAFVVVCLAAAPHESHDEGLGRITFMLLMALFGIFVHRALGPTRGAASPGNASHPDSWIVRLRVVWYAFLMLSIGALVVAAGMGYYETARELARRVVGTLFLLFGVTLIQALLVRFLNVANRRLALRKAIERREARHAESAESHADGPKVAIDDEELDIATIDQQTRKLLYSVVGVAMVLGLVGIWAGVVPALGFLENVSLWQVSEIVDGQEAKHAITLADLGIALLLGVLIVVAARNLPGVLEIALLQRLPINPGTRYAITTICQYVIVGVGISAGFGLIGLKWDNIQWLVAALGVGLGFGLQEIVANFVSGVIILFEQPVRIGDTVTVGELSGTVTKIRIRATTIKDWDNKEIIVPNKMFITERLINWTLSDPITRVIIKVGIAYGSDTAKAHDVMLGVAKANPMVLDAPEPAVYFLGFGESALDFEVRVFVRELGHRLPLMHELHMSIDRALRENGFEIPFPQRDIHIRSSVAGENALTGDEPPAAAGSEPSRATQDDGGEPTPLRRTGQS